MAKIYQVKASEIGDYVYCKRGWWLRRKGLLSDNEQMLDGQIKHNDLVSNIRTYTNLKIAIQVFIALLLVISLMVLYINLG